ncbi:MAG: dienelactone hydrolase family protein [Bacteroidota bacterium]|nr:dienelactone hydrolase family protein [Bacteroidota bacterium]MDP4190439.1 dienelactone hydrolase family protein [Bacteroidota bacterium]MDP4194187.1 dienelactone hydrolase family protein [Bacteroidota bacterium]
MSSVSEAKIHTQNVDYNVDGKTYQGYLAYDDAIKEKRPGILIVHEWWGVNDYPKKRAEQIAQLGYIAFAADMYGKGIVAKSPDEAGKLAGTVRKDPSQMRKLINAALQLLKENPKVDPSNVAAMGYCFGGTVALELARSGADIKGVCTFHATLDTKAPEDAKNIKAKILVCTGADDKAVPPEQRQAFQKEMDAAGVDWEMNIYSGAVHSFTNPASGNDPSKGVAYNEKADKRSWEAMKAFYSEIFGKIKNK